MSDAAAERLHDLIHEHCDHPPVGVDTSAYPAWAAYLAEFLLHGLWHLHQDSEKDRRMALITIDGAVEMVMRTFFILPSHVTGLYLSRKERDSIGEGFCDLVDAVRKFAPERMSEHELNDIESYHRCRNELSRTGNGAMVECHKVEAYGVIAKRLFSALYGYNLGTEDSAADLSGWMA